MHSSLLTWVLATAFERRNCREFLKLKIPTLLIALAPLSVFAQGSDNPHGGSPASSE